MSEVTWTWNHSSKGIQGKKKEPIIRTQAIEKFKRLVEEDLVSDDNIENTNILWNEKVKPFIDQFRKESMCSVYVLGKLFKINKMMI